VDKDTEAEAEAEAEAEEKNTNAAESTDHMQSQVLGTAHTVATTNGARRREAREERGGVPRSGERQASQSEQWAESHGRHAQHTHDTCCMEAVGAKEGDGPTEGGG
jgi:hypothetical protein